MPYQSTKKRWDVEGHAERNTCYDVYNSASRNSRAQWTPAQDLTATRKVVRDQK